MIILNDPCLCTYGTEAVRHFHQKEAKCIFLNEPISASFCLFSSFSDHNFYNKIVKSVDTLPIRTRGCRMVGVDEITELWRPPEEAKSYLEKTTYLVMSNESLLPISNAYQTFEYIPTYGDE